MAKITFLFGNHNHQPIGNFDSVFEEAYQKSYRPFFDILFKHPAIHWNLHCTGILWEWLENHHPDTLDIVAAMVERKQLELLSGGFYEPILPMIPNSDKIGQIKKLNQYLKNKFLYTPRGMWCAERVWEPHLPQPLRESDMEYTVLDDNHFTLSGLDESKLRGYYKVEELGFALDIFPISKELRYAIPFKKPEEVIKIFKGAADESTVPNPCLTLMDDGEKFGLWPDTYKSVYTDGWLETFISLLEKNSSWIYTQTFSEYRCVTAPLGKTYIPCASYSEMLEWSKGFWRNFLAKYPESDWMHKKMLRLSKKVQDFKKIKRLPSKAVAQKLEEAQTKVWAGQCNCAYWHGIFGGLYLPVLRGAVYKNLIAAETLLYEISDELDKNKLPARIDKKDFNADGKEELIIETPKQNLYFSLEEGGMLKEWDFKGLFLHISNVLSRRPESYHEQLKNSLEDKDDLEETVQSIHNLTQSKEAGLQNSIFYDWYNRGNFIDHFLHPDTDLDSFQKCHYGEQGNFVGSPYHCKMNRTSVLLSKTGMVWVDASKKEIRLSKEIEFLTFPKKGKKELKDSESASLIVTYSIRALENIASLWFAPEHCFSFSVPDPTTDISQKGVTSWERIDAHLGWKLTLSFSCPTDLWIFPLETVSNSEGGFEKTFQGTIVVPNWKFSLMEKETLQREMTYLVEKI